MKQSDQERLLKALHGTASLLGHDLDPDALVLLVDDLAAYPLQAVLEALSSVRREGAPRLTLKAIMDRLGHGLSHIRGNAAWAVALPAEDERNSIVWTREMQRAWGVALPLVQNGDMIAARMAFLEAYEQFCAEARNAGRAPEVVMSRGWDATTTAAAIDRARGAGLLTVADAEGMAVSIGPAVPHLQGNGNGFAGLIAGFAEGIRQESLSNEQKQSWKDLIADLKAGPARREQARWEQHERERAELEALKQLKLDELNRAELASDA